MFLIYDLIFFIIALFYLPLYLLRKKFHRGFIRRLGFLPRDLNLNQPIWIHAVSVGEAKALKKLIEELKRIEPDKKFVFSTVTATGNKIMQDMAGDHDLVTYLPLDFSWVVSGVLERVNPSLFIIAETEIWPNLITALRRKNIPTVVINARISDRSLRGYKMLKIFIKPILNKVHLFCVQSQTDATRLMKLGVAVNKIKITGNLKFDSADLYLEPVGAHNYKASLGLTKEEKLLVAGSTHAQEEQIILSVYKELLKAFGELKLLLAPRHPQRAPELKNLVSLFGFHPVLISNLPFHCPTCIPKPVFILDTIGQLNDFYAIADVVFVGGSLVKSGGHNILEPAAKGKAVLFGPYMFNFRDIADLFLRNQAAILVENQEELKNKLSFLLSRQAERQKLGARAQELVIDNQGATRRTLEFII